MVESTIDKIKDITVERQIRKLAGVIDEQNKKIEESIDFSTDIDNLKTSDANQNTEINKLKIDSAAHTTDIDNLKTSDANQNTQINNLKQSVEDDKQDIESAITDINELKASDANQTTQINNLKQSVATDKLATESAITALQNKDAEQDGTLTNHATLIQGITESLVSNVQIMPGNTTGDIKVRLDRESAVAIDSNNYNLGLPVSAEIIQGTGPSMFKIQITMSTGVKVVSNDFVFTTEAIGNDVYISSFTFKAGNQDGYLSADIGLNNGVTIEANNFLVPTDPNVTSAITDLQSRVSTTENKITELNGLKTTVNEHTNEINTLNSDVAGLITDKADVNNSEQTIVAGTVKATNITKGGVAVATVNDIPSVPDISGKADLNNSSQTIVAGTINATNINKNGVSVATINDIPSVPDISGKADKNNSSQTIVAGTIKATNITKGNVNVATVNDIPNISGKVDKAQGVGNAGKVLGIGSDGNVTPVAVSSGGEEWEEVDLSHFPTNWVENDRIKVQFDILVKMTAPNNWTTAPTSTLSISSNNGISRTPIIELSLKGGDGSTIVKYPLVGDYSITSHCKYSLLSLVFGTSEFNKGNLFNIWAGCFNGAGCKYTSIDITTKSNFSCVYKMWRLKK